MTRFHILAAALAGAVPVVAFATPAEAQQREFNIPGGSLADVLNAFVAQSGTQLLYRAGELKAARSSGVVGRMDPADALKLILKGSGYTSVQDSSGARAIVRSAEGNAPAGGEERPADSTAITVTGTRIRGVGSTSPVIVSTRRQLEQAGITDIADFTRILPQNYPGGQNRGIAGGGEQGGQQNLNNSATLNLRGLGPDATLTLLNGHRLAYDSVFQGIDISAIPLSAIERIEVVADGASALYGSDAVGGVANIILRRDYEGLETTARVGAAMSGGDVEQDYNLVAGHRWATGGFMVALDRSSATPIYAGQRDYSRTVDRSLTLTDGNRQLSGVLNAHQQLAPGVTLEFDANLMDRSSLLHNPFLADADVHVSGLVSRPHVLSYALAPTVRVDLGSWQASLGGTMSVSRTLLDTKNYSNGVPRHGRLLYKDKLKGVELTAEGPLFALPGGEARLALGGGARGISLHDRYRYDLSGVWTTTKDFIEKRGVQFAYGELSLPLVSPELNLPLVDRLMLSAAIRYEHWNHIAAVSTPKLGVIYQPLRDLTIRGTWGKSFKIPTLLQVNQPEEGDLVPGFYFVPPPQPPGSTILFLSGSAPNLKPERATTWSGTVEFTPGFLRGLDLRATYFYIDYRGRIASPFTAGVLSALYNPIYSDFIVYNPSPAELSALIATLPGGLVNQTGAPFDPSNVGAIVDAAVRNTARQRIRGVDVNGDYRLDLGRAGKLLLTGAASYLESDQQLAPGQPIFQLAGTVFNPPHWRGRAGAVWSRGDAQLAAFVNYVGPRKNNVLPTTQNIGSFVTLDLNAMFRTGARAGPLRNMEFGLSALNVLNEEPHVIGNVFPNAAPYDSTNESPVGRFIRASIRKVW